MKAGSRKRALLVGINEYGAHSGLAPLRFAEADAARMDACLQAFGYETRVLPGAGATNAHIEKALRELASEPSDLFVFYFAGHGEELDGHHQLYCHGAESGYTSGALRMGGAARGG